MNASIFGRLFEILSGIFNRLIARSLPFVPRSIVGRVASRYIAGETLDDAVSTVRSLEAQGFDATVDVLGEEVTDATLAGSAVDAYLGLVDRLATEGVGSNVSLKLSQLGLRLSRKQGLANLLRIAKAASERGIFVRVDMEDSSLTELTLDVVREARKTYPRMGFVVQAYLRRTAADVEQIIADGASVRLCKGIYREPEALAFQDREEVRQSFLSLAKRLLGSGSYVGLATHDMVLLDALRAHLRDAAIPKDCYEIQALLGVPITATLDELRKEGHRVRIYVPYGSHWYPYSVRRLKENPAVAGYVFRAMFRRDRGLLAAPERG